MREIDLLNENSAIIRINKEDKSQRLYISIGTFIKDSNEEKDIFKVFTRQQLIDFSSKYIFIINNILYNIL